MRTTWLISAVVFLMIGGRLASGQPATAEAEKAPNVFESPVPPVAAGQIDKLVFAKLSSLGIQPVLCSDAVFVRRAYLDVIGTLPTAKEAREFIQDPDTKNKRRALIDRLLERDEFADYWAMKWGDILRIKAEFPVNLWPNAAQAYHRWVRASHRREQALRQVRPRAAHLQRQQFPRRPGQLLPRHPEPHAGRHRRAPWP